MSFTSLFDTKLRIENGGLKKTEDTKGIQSGMNSLLSVRVRFEFIITN